jgi:hypothetical protein
MVAHDRRADDSPADPSLDPAVRRTARRLSRDLVRVHPSFRFEERLAARLSETAARMRLQAAAGGEEVVVAAPFALAAASDPLARDALGPPDGRDAPRDRRPDASGPAGPVAAGPAGPVARPLLIGGALTSAAISLAGAAYVAWRRGHIPMTPLGRAARAAHAARATAERGRVG